MFNSPGGQIEVVDSFVYLGSIINWQQSGDPMLDRFGTELHELTGNENLEIQLNTKLRLFQTYVVPVLLNMVHNEVPL